MYIYSFHIIRLLGTVRDYLKRDDNHTSRANTHYKSEAIHSDGRINSTSTRLSHSECRMSMCQHQARLQIQKYAIHVHHRYLPSDYYGLDTLKSCYVFSVMFKALNAFNVRSSIIMLCYSISPSLIFQFFRYDHKSSCSLAPNNPLRMRHVSSPRKNTCSTFCRSDNTRT